MCSPPELLHFRVSHYNEKVRWALDFKRWPHHRTALVPGFHAPRMLRLTRQTKVPVLVIDGEPIRESSRIIAEIERRHPEPALYPDSPALVQRALQIQSFFDDDVAPDIRRIFWSLYLPSADASASLSAMGASDAARLSWRALYRAFHPLFRSNMDIDEGTVARAHARLDGYLERLAREIGPNGYLVGERFGLADLAAASIMSGLVRPPQFPYPLPEPRPPRLLELQARIAQHEAVRWVESIYRRHRGASAALRDR